VGTRTRNGAAGPLEILQARGLATLPWLVHGFSTRLGGESKVYGGSVLNLGFTKHDSRAAVERNREAFLRKLGAGSGAGRWPLI
jgi:hypothetical protein